MSSGGIQKKFVLGFVLFSLLIGIIGFVIGYFSAPRSASSDESPKKRRNSEAQSGLYEKALDQISTDRLKDKLK